MSPVVVRQPSLRQRLNTVMPELEPQFGFVPLTVRVRLFLNTIAGTATSTLFLFDSGATHSVLGLEVALSSRLTTISRLGPEFGSLQTSAQGLTPIRYRAGRLRAWWDEQRRGSPFDWPVLFRVNAPLNVPWVIGLGGVVSTCRWTFDGGYSPEYPSGYLSLEDIR